MNPTLNNNSAKKSLSILEALNEDPFDNSMSSGDITLKPVHTKASNVKPRHQTPSKTLMRKAVSKPGPSIKRLIKINESNRSRQPSLNDLNRKSSLSIYKKPRSSLKISKSHKIKHFSYVDTSALSQLDSKVKVPVKVTPKEYSPSNITPVAFQPKVKPATRTVEDILERAMNQATSHLEPPPKISKAKRRRLAKGWAAFAIFALLTVVGVSQNLTSIKIQFAAAKAGFSATLPKTMPSGYKLSSLNYTSGTVITNFHGNANRDYSIVQRISDWNSLALQNDFVAKSDPNYVTVASNGLSIYIFGNRNASWVSNGIWYVIQSNGNLSNNQLVQMASSS
jgi:hypothetical protein